MHRWVFEEANHLMSEESMKRREAFTKAYLTWRLLEALGQGIVTFRYEKENGEVRRARGTLRSGIAADFDRYEYKHEEDAAFEQVQERLSMLKDDDKRTVAEQLFRYVNYLESVQQMPLLLRLKFYEVVVPVYNFLRKNKQLARHEGAFTTPVRMFIHQLMSKSTQRGRFSLCTFPVGAIRSTQREPSPLCTSNKLSNGKLSNCK